MISVEQAGRKCKKVIFLFSFLLMLGIFMNAKPTERETRKSSPKMEKGKTGGKKNDSTRIKEQKQILPEIPQA